MGFRKAVYDVEEKGLDPTKPHNNIGMDGRLAPNTDQSNLPVAIEPEKAPTAPKKASNKKAAPSQKKEAATLKSQKSKKEVSKPRKVPEKSEDSDELLSALLELPTEVKESKPKESKSANNKRTTKRKTPARKTIKKKVSKKEDA